MKKVKNIILTLLLISLPVILTEQFIFEARKSQIEQIWIEINDLNIEYPSIVFSQAMLESNFATSDLFSENNNLFGMKYSGSRPTTSNKIHNGYKKYKDWRESIIDYALLQSCFYRNLSKDEYYNKLQSIYAEDKNYVINLKIIENKILNNEFNFVIKEKNNIFVENNLNINEKQKFTTQR